MPHMRKGPTVALAVLFLLGMAAGARADVITYDLLDAPLGKHDPGGFYKKMAGDARLQVYSFEPRFWEGTA